MQRLIKGQVASLPEKNIRNDNFLQRLFVTWVYHVVSLGRKGQLKQEELCMPKAQASEEASATFNQQWDKERTKSDGSTSIMRALWAAFGWEFALAGVFKLLWSGFVLLGASYFVNALVEFVQQKEGWDAIPNKGVGWVLACSFFADSILAGLALQRMGDVSVRVGIKMRAALITNIYRKAFRLNQTHNDDAGNIVSLVSTDCIKVYEGVQHAHNVWTAPLEAATIIALLLWRTGGVYGLPALGVVVVVLPLQYYFGYRIAMYKMANVEVSDARVMRMHEVLLAIKLVKFYAWEKSFAKQVEDVREKELKLIASSAMVKTANLCLVFVVPPLIALVIYATYAFSVGKMTSAMAFVVLSLFNTLRFPLVVLPKALRGVSEGAAALKRIQGFLQLPESTDNERSTKTEARIEGGHLHYGNPEDFTLEVPKFEVNPGEVVAIVGKVGSGKSSVLQAILGKMTAQQGSVHVGGSIAYVPQTPWVQNLTLRENILFGLEFDEAKYNAVIHAAALELDLKILPKGDQSIAGERGINLSGGQRQRVCLARAAYHNCDIVLLDNPLSAVDQHTGKHIFDHCIKGMLKDKAVVLIGHQLELLPACNKVGIMKDGKMVYFGPYDSAALNKHMPVDGMLHDATVEGKESATAPKHDDKAEAGKAESLIKAKTVEDDCLETAEEVARKFDGTCKRLGAGSAAYVYWGSGGYVLGVVCLAIFGVTQACRIVSDWWIRSWAADDPAHFYARFDVHHASQLYILIYMALVLTFWIMLVGRDTLFSFWAIRASTNLHNQLFTRVLNAPMLFFLRTPVGDVLNAFARDQDTMDETLPDTLHMTSIYLMILLTSLAIVASGIPVYVCMIGALFISFFMMQYLYLPAATVLKRWAGDSANAVFVHVDESLQGMDVIRAFSAVDYFIQENVVRLNLHNLSLFNTEQTHLWLAFWCDFFGAVLVVATCLFSVAFSETLGAPNVGLAISNSIQVLVFYTWVVRGVADTVSMWDAVERVTSFATQLPSEMSDADAAAEASNAPALPAPTKSSKSMVAAKSFARRNGAHLAGAHSVRLNVTPEQRLASAVRLSTEHDRRASLDHEQHALPGVVKEDQEGVLSEIRVVGGDKKPFNLADWPTTGDLVFDRVCLRYFPGGQLALRNVSFHVTSCEKVGVVGRTGSGKTTLLMALFRLLDLARGAILVDGVDIAGLPLRQLRRRICIIPQEPVMFKGSVRSNLDPFGEASDNELWHALSLVHLKQAVADLPGGLDGAVQEGGSNFSLGQKQLICMARCVLKKSRILVLDEATAAMDLQTDILIQRTIRRVFKDRTTLTIAHRLDTIIFSDKILAMGQGQVKEFDTPHVLLQNSVSMFNKLVEDTGPVASAALRQMAANGPQDD